MLAKHIYSTAELKLIRELDEHTYNIAEHIPHYSLYCNLAVVYFITEETSSAIEALRRVITALNNNETRGTSEFDKLCEF